MNIVSHRLATRATLLAVGIAGIAAIGAWPGIEPMVLPAVLWLSLLGWGFHTLLGRHLGFSDRLVFAEAQRELERHARTQAEQALGDTHTTLCRLVQQQEQVRETERNRIARDIHDDLGQHLLALKIELSLMQVSTSGVHPQVHQKIGSLLQHLDQAIGSLRTIINDLRPLALEHGLRNAMEAQLAEFSRISGIPHQLEADPGAFHAKSGRSVDAMLFRILQESLTNVARHAQATEVKITLIRSAELLTLQVRDNGIGMAGHPPTRGCGMAGHPPTRGCGLAGIADRVAAAGGKFVIDTQPGAGTLLSLSIPLTRPMATL